MQTKECHVRENDMDVGVYETLLRTNSGCNFSRVLKRRPSFLEQITNTPVVWALVGPQTTRATGKHPNRNGVWHAFLAGGGLILSGSVCMRVHY